MITRGVLDGRAVEHLAWVRVGVRVMGEGGGEGDG